jgi:hypothetical protein
MPFWDFDSNFPVRHSLSRALHLFSLVGYCSRRLIPNPDPVPGQSSLLVVVAQSSLWMLPLFATLPNLIHVLCILPNTN